MLKKYSKFTLILLLLLFTFSLTTNLENHAVVYAQDNVISFEDINLKAAIKQILGKAEKEEVTYQDAIKVSGLDLTAKNISNLEGLQYFENLQTLKLAQNKISNLGALANLMKIDYLELNNNKIKDISPLSGLKRLVFLNISDNQIKNISPLKDLTKLAYLHARNNEIYDISMLDQLDEFDLIDLTNNHISDISVIRDLFGFRHGLVLEQTIELPSQEVKRGTSVIIPNPIKDKDGAVTDIQVNGGYYDESSNTVVFENVAESKTLSYTFNKIVNIIQNGDVEFSGTVSIGVTVLPNQKPILSGVVDKVISLGETFDPFEGVSAFDEEDGNLTNKIQLKGEVNSNKEGEYKLVYEVTDSDNETTTADRIITVVPKAEAVNQIPTIDATNRIIKIGETFDPLEGVTSFDVEDGDLTPEIQIVNNTVDTKTPGTYEVTYKVVDHEGAETILTIMVMVREIPQTGVILPIGFGLTLLVGSALIIYREKRQS